MKVYQLLVYTGYRFGVCQYELRNEFKSLKEAKIYKDREYSTVGTKIKRINVNSNYFDDNDL